MQVTDNFGNVFILKPEYSHISDTYHAAVHRYLRDLASELYDQLLAAPKDSIMVTGGLECMVVAQALDAVLQWIEFSKNQYFVSLYQMIRENVTMHIVHEGYGKAREFAILLEESAIVVETIYSRKGDPIADQRAAEEFLKLTDPGETVPVPMELSQQDSYSN